MRGFAALRVSLAATPREFGIVLRGDEGTIRVDLARGGRLLLQVPPGAGRRTRQLRVAVVTAAQTALGVVGRALGKATGRLRGFPVIARADRRLSPQRARRTPPPVPFHEGAAAVRRRRRSSRPAVGDALASARSVPA